MSVCACVCPRTYVYVSTCMFLRVLFWCTFSVYVSTCTLRVCVYVYMSMSAYALTVGLRMHLGLCGPVRARGPGRAHVCRRGMNTGFSTT